MAVNAVSTSSRLISRIGPSPAAPGLKASTRCSNGPNRSRNAATASRSAPSSCSTPATRPASAATLLPAAREHAEWATGVLRTMAVQQAKHPLIQKVGQVAEKTMDTVRNAVTPG
ncbi:exported hypothetical protein [Frankia canadensis]|uniref:Uncharacterized protein n=1 Tax=Frankia canadensis TaxID=1836972 RepID=A0A2I2KYV9_9ACTN|nr:exported hypothetical protein [Frankia canadensis]SOU58143.1 exported hypothetical protein [Frankia canadensis]